MSEDKAAAKIFSESWHRVAEVRAALRPSVDAHRQVFRGETWYVLRDPFKNEFFRISKDAYDFLCRLRADRTVDEVWREAVEADPENALGQEEVVQLLGQLNLSNLLYFDRPEAVESIFERYRKRRKREIKSKLMGFLAIRIPLFDPDRFLNRALGLIRAIYSPLGALIWLGLILYGLKTAAAHHQALFDQAGNLLAASNLVLFYTGFVLAKAVHEFGHASAIKRFGGEVHVIGLMLLVFAPIPYVDGSGAWAFRQPSKRLLVGSAGMLGEFAVAAVAIGVWANTAPGPANALAYNILFVATVSTFLFNINPLLRFDGYYMLVDLLDLPNLFQRSREEMKFLAKRYLFGMRSVRSAARTRGEAWLLPSYGVLSLAYWTTIITGILIFVSQQYLDLGLLLAVLLIVMFVVVPTVKFLYFLVFDPSLFRRRLRAISVTSLLVAVVVGLVGGVPVPDRIRAEGVVKAHPQRSLATEAAGFVAAVAAEPGTRIEAGQVLVRLRNARLAFDLAAAQRQRDQLVAQLRRAQAEGSAGLAAIRDQLAAVDTAIANLERRQAALAVRAPFAGVWSAPELDLAPGDWVARGESLGEVLDTSGFRFIGVVPQVATHLFDASIRRAELRLTGQEHINLSLPKVTIVPYDQGRLPSPALGQAGGGPIAIDRSDPRGTLAKEPFFRLEAPLDAEAVTGSARLLHGLSGTVRLTLDDRPLLAQWLRGLRQFLQEQYRL